MSSTFKPSSARPAARLMAVVLLATPPFLVGYGNYHVVRLRFTDSDAISLSREERAILRSFASWSREVLSSIGATNLINASFLLLLLSILGTSLGLYYKSKQFRGSMSITKMTLWRVPGTIFKDFLYSLGAAYEARCTCLELRAVVYTAKKSRSRFYHISFWQSHLWFADLRSEFIKNLWFEVYSLPPVSYGGPILNIPIVILTPSASYVLDTKCP